MKKLSICISTFNRESYIKETLDTIVPQLNENVELVLVDAGTSNETQKVVSNYIKKNNFIRYFKESVNSGVDGDYDKAIKYAYGEFCWLMTDDDLLEVDAINKVLNKINKTVDLIVVNSKVMNIDLTVTLADRQLNILSDVKYKDLKSGFFQDVGAYLSFIGCVVIRRKLWISRNRVDYFGTTFTHVGVICQNPPISNIYVISNPLIVIRYGNAMWTDNAFNVWNVKWPELIWSFESFSDQEKLSICRKQPYTRLSTLLYNKAMGAFSLKEFYKKRSSVNFLRFYLLYIISYLIPGYIINYLFIIYFKNYRKSNKIAIHDLLISKYNLVFSVKR